MDCHVASLLAMTEVEMNARKTARALLFDADGRLLLVKMHDPSVAAENGAVEALAYWVTIGGEIDEGESLEAAVRREIAEETGFTRVRLGPAVWNAEHVLMVRGTKKLFQETFVLAYTDETDWSTKGWTKEESEVIEHLQWWEPNALLASGETFFPTSLKDNLALLQRRPLPDKILTIEP